MARPATKTLQSTTLVPFSMSIAIFVTSGAICWVVATGPHHPSRFPQVATTSVTFDTLRQRIARAIERGAALRPVDARVHPRQGVSPIYEPSGTSSTDAVAA